MARIHIAECQIEIGKNKDLHYNSFSLAIFIFNKKNAVVFGSGRQFLYLKTRKNAVVFGSAWPFLYLKTRRMPLYFGAGRHLQLGSFLSLEMDKPVGI